MATRPDASQDDLYDVAHAMAAGRPAVDLSSESVSVFLRSLSTVAQQAVRSIEDKETWTADEDPEVATAIQELTQLLSEAALIEVADDPPAELITFLGNVRVARSLLFLDVLTDASGAGQTPRDFILAGRDAAAQSTAAQQAWQVCLSRLLHLGRTEALARIYSPRRAQAIVEAIQGVLE